MYVPWYIISRIPALVIAVAYRASEYWRGWGDGMPLMSRLALYLVPGVGELMLARLIGIFIYNITHPQTP